MQSILGSWKEIASYLGKGVRTVQRWERCSGLPIHRPSGTSKGVVIAFPAELDQWARRKDRDGRPFAPSTLQRNIRLSHQLADHNPSTSRQYSEIDGPDGDFHGKSQAPAK